MTGEVLCRDVHPAEVALPDGRVLTATRAFVTTHRVVAFQVVDDRIDRVLDVELAEPGSVEASHNTLRGALEARTPSGTVWVNPGQGCGCHSPLKRLAAPVPWRLS